MRKSMWLTAVQAMSRTQRLVSGLKTHVKCDPHLIFARPGLFLARA